MKSSKQWSYIEEMRDPRAKIWDNPKLKDLGRNAGEREANEASGNRVKNVFHREGSDQLCQMLLTKMRTERCRLNWAWMSFVSLILTRTLWHRVLLNLKKKKLYSCWMCPRWNTCKVSDLSTESRSVKLFNHYTYFLYISRIFKIL